MKNKNRYVHIPVLLDEVIAILDPQPGESLLDVTAGYGGHASAILERTQAPQQSVLVDRDVNSVTYITDRFQDSGVTVFHQDYLTASRQLLAQQRQFDLILADVGLSSPHLDNQSRGFSFQTEGPLDMRMDQRQSLTAAAIVNDRSEAELTEILRQYGEEPRAATIAKAIVAHRPLRSTAELARTIERTVGRRGKIHPATQTFQALRIAVNNELEQLEQGIAVWIELLKPGGRLAVISFHSLEDRIVKVALADASGSNYDSRLKLLTPHPVTAQKNEIVSNPRARSAKLRAAVKK